jgi:xanthine dehydrogenase YagS FAD-binding subunit
MCVALVALDAIVRLRGPGGERTVPVTDFHLAPGEHPEREHVLQPGELIVAVDLPPMAFARRSTYVKVRDRASYAFALASAAVALDIRDGLIRDARIALGGVATKPWRAWEAERLLDGRRPERESYRAAAEAALAGAVPYRHNGFKVELAKRTIVRALSKVGSAT